MFLELSLLILVSLVVAFIFRILYVIRSVKNEKFNKSCARTLIIIGSGGHTSEMTRQIIKLDPRLYQPRLYVLADSDSSSKAKINVVESHFKELSGGTYFIEEIPRSRNPDLILCNGPGTCIPVCVVGFLLKVLFLSKTKIIFIESICRVKSLSLSGKILLRFADKVLVQWSELQHKYPKSEYIGRLT